MRRGSQRPRRAISIGGGGAALVLAASLVLTQLPVAVGATTFTPGAAGVGDPYFPKEGNGGYDVAHYGLALSYAPSSHQLAGTATITATATQNLSRFDLDLSGMTVHAVTVNGTAATWTRSGQELRITPHSGLPKGQSFTTAVTYDGSPKTIKGSPIVFGADYGWQYTPDGAFVGDEPNASSTWFPCNDHPSDKASYTFTISVPTGKEVVANGDLTAQTTQGSTSTFVWDETSPMATYLATIDIGNWTFVRGTTPGGIPNFTAYDPDLKSEVAAEKVIDTTNAVTDYWAKEFGPYPFTSTGAIVDNLPSVGFSLETQTRPLYGFAPDSGTISHELSHQWFGDSVSVATWQDIWLNEGFASFAADLWIEHTGGSTTFANGKSIWQSIPANDSFWDQSIADPQRNTMFSDAVYTRGDLTLSALRHRIGDADFFRLLQTWTKDHRYGNADTAQFVALAQQVSGENLTAFFQTWLWAKTKPATFG
jgi:aminopeptidase N